MRFCPVLLKIVFLESAVFKSLSLEEFVQHFSVVCSINVVGKEERSKNRIDGNCAPKLKLSHQSKAAPRQARGFDLDLVWLFCLFTWNVR
jgi:hypothetical protein